MAKKWSSAHRTAKYKIHAGIAENNKLRRIAKQKKFEEKKRIKKLKRQEAIKKMAPSNMSGSSVSFL